MLRRPKRAIVAAGRAGSPTWWNSWKVDTSGWAMRDCDMFLVWHTWIPKRVRACIENAQTKELDQSHWFLSHIPSRALLFLPCFLARALEYSYKPMNIELACSSHPWKPLCYPSVFWVETFSLDSLNTRCGQLVFHKIRNSLLPGTFPASTQRKTSKNTPRPWRSSRKMVMKRLRTRCARFSPGRGGELVWRWEKIRQVGDFGSGYCLRYWDYEARFSMKLKAIHKKNYEKRLVELL